MWAEIGGLPRVLILQSFSRRIDVTIIGDDRGERIGFTQLDLPTGLVMGIKL